MFFFIEMQKMTGFHRLGVVENSTPDLKKFQAKK